MSGGSFDYLSYTMESALHLPDVHYSNLCDEEREKIARKRNVMCDRQLSELVYDIACLLHSLEWAQSGDTSYESYNADVRKFKKKWLSKNVDANSRYREACRQELMDLAKELADEYFGADEELEGGE